MSTHDIGVIVELGLAVVTFISLWWISAPYGRHARPGWGPTVPPRMGWILMELPAALGFIGIYALGAQAKCLGPLVLLALWQSHYLHRAFIYPFRLPPSSKRMPLTVVAMGFAFNVLNAWINARWISQLGSYPPSWLMQPQFIIGTAVFLGGMTINQHADAVLLRLRRAGQYAVPTGGLYRWVSCPNYLGEIVEWSGWALASWSLPGLAFALYTTANLLPRAVTHHRWYQQRFDSYPRERRAIIPYVF